MKVPNLNNHNIQLDDWYGHYAIDEGKDFLVYAPLAGVFFLADTVIVQQLEETMGTGDNENGEMLELVA